MIYHASIWRKGAPALPTRAFLAIAMVALLWLAMSVPAIAQMINGTLTGTVKDSQGGIIPGASVTIISESRATSAAPVLTNERGEFVVPNIVADVYTIQVEVPSFKTLKRQGVQVPAGSRIEVGTLTLEVGGGNEVVTVQADAAQVRVTGMEQSFVIPTHTVQDLPLPERNFLALLDLMPGINYTGGLGGIDIVGGQGGSNFLMDGATAMETGSNRLVSNVSVEAIGEVKVVTTSYQAEYGRSSGLQINAVTKSGTNKYHGSAYLSWRDQRWAANSVENKANGDQLEFEEYKDWGWTIGGPVKIPKIRYFEDKLFFFYNQEFNPRTRTGDTVRYRFPTELERKGDFSQTTDNNSALYPYIKDPLISGTCSSSNTAACFKDGGVLGKIPAARLYQPGINILNWYPKPNLTDTTGLNYNYLKALQDVSITGWQPLVRLDYHPTNKLQASFKFMEYQQPNSVVPGTLPGWNDTKMDNYGIYVLSTTITYTVGPKFFLEGTYGANYHHQEGCSITGGSPNFCTSGLRMNDAANRTKSGMGDIPYLFPDATIINPDYFAYDILNKVKPAYWDGKRLDKAYDFSWSGRISNSPPNQSAPGFILNTTAKNISISFTKIQGSHTLKGGYYYFKNFGPRGSGSAFGTISFGNTTNNEWDSQFGYANAALGVFQTYSQNSKWIEGGWTTINTEWFLQDSWKVRSNLTLDLGLRFVRQLPQYDPLMQSSNFLLDKWVAADVPKVYVYGCSNGKYPCSGNTRVAMNPVTGEFLSSRVSSSAVGTLVPLSGNFKNGLFQAGQGISKYNYTWPGLVLAPRLGFAWDIFGKQSLVLRGGFGIFYDRPDGNSVYSLSNNPPFVQSATVYYGFLQDLAKAGLTMTPASTINAFQYDSKVPTSAQWNFGVQMNAPFDTIFDVAYIGRSNYNSLATYDINTIDIGSAFLAANQDPSFTVTSTTAPGAASLANQVRNAARPMKGFASVSIRTSEGWSDYHGLQIQWNRRLKNGIGFGINDTYSIYARSDIGWRLKHAADGSFTLRDDMAKAYELFGNDVNQLHQFKANFNWALPQLRAGGRILRQIANGWQLTGTWVGSPGGKYAIGASYQSNGSSINLTGSPDYGARVTVVGDPGSGCSDDIYRQFNTNVFMGPVTGSVGLESSSNYMKGCFQHSFNLSLARNIRIERGGRTYTLQLRIDAFNALNHASINGRSTTMSLPNPTQNTSAYIINSFYKADGTIDWTRKGPDNAGFGVASGWQDPRYIQAQVKFTF